MRLQWLLDMLTDRERHFTAQALVFALLIAMGAVILTPFKLVFVGVFRHENFQWKIGQRLAWSAGTCATGLGLIVTFLIWLGDPSEENQHESGEYDSNEYQ